MFTTTDPARRGRLRGDCRRGGTEDQYVARRALRLKRRAELAGEIAEIAGDGLSRANEFGKDAANFHEISRPDWLDRFRDAPQGMIAPAAEL
ncbi:hypothetical protein [Sinorhizobium sp. 22678]|uniref:hypothetical protein n=1 Tax=Sinorhizobium sp. 22678 TaxID=3453955 RepID=UPI003F83C377